VKWYQKAADHGNAEAQTNLGFMHANGQGTPFNPSLAYCYWQIVRFNGRAEGKEGLEALKRIMTPAQITKAEELVKEMLKKNPKLLNKKD